MARRSPKCCCCVPLRPGLLAWAYFKLVLGLTSIGLFLYYTWFTFEYYYYIYYHGIRGGPPQHGIWNYLDLDIILGILGMLVYLLFTIIFIIGVHRENSKLLRAFLVYSVFEVIIGFVVVGWQMFYFVSALLYYRNHSQHYDFDEVLHAFIDDPTFYLRLLGSPVVFILLPIYLMVLTKSEMQRLKISRGGTHVVLNQPVAIEQDKRYNLRYIH